MEAKLRIKLPDDLPAALSDGIVLCHLVNNLRKGTIQVIHVPSSGVVSNNSLYRWFSCDLIIWFVL